MKSFIFLYDTWFNPDHITMISELNKNSWKPYNDDPNGSVIHFACGTQIKVPHISCSNVLKEIQKQITLQSKKE